MRQGLHLEETALWDAGRILSAVLLTRFFSNSSSLLWFFLFKLADMFEASVWLGFAAVAAGSSDVLLFLSSLFRCFCCFFLPLAVDYTSYGRGLPTRVFRMFEFYIIPAWSCRNSAGCT